MMTSTVLKHKMINQWNLFRLVAIPISILMVVEMMRSDLSRAESISSLIQLSVRWSVPWLYLAFAASSVQIVFPGEVSRWMLRNRKFLGLCFAAAMAWQGLFIVWLTTVHREYYIEEVYVLRDAIEGTVGYLFLAAMTVTSFKPGRRLLSSKQWKYLHKSGMYYLWAYAFSVYWWNLFYYKNPVMIDYVFYLAGLLAWAVRAAAWHAKRVRRLPEAGDSRAHLGILGWLMIGFGLVASATGLSWQEPVEEFLTGYWLTTPLDLYMPYWPFVPFLPLFAIGIGTWLLAKSRK